MVVMARNLVGEARSLVEEARSLEVHSLETGIVVVVVDNHVAARSLEKTLRRGMRRPGA